MAASPRIVAELGRPETPEETAARKAESSRLHRNSRTIRNGVAALLVTLGVVLVVVIGVPRGTAPPAEPIDVAAEAAEAQTALDRPVIAPDTPDDWSVNRATVDGEDGVQAWTVVYAPPQGFVNVAQGFDADESWPTRVLAGSSATGKATIDGVEWTVYDISDPDETANISYALSTPAGTDTVMVYGATDAGTAAEVAESLTDDVRRLREDAP
ncbi:MULTISPECIES: DUF4245 domain-containing protein [unclassified Microbacterium]|uniref:DUF4245 domain-containing protein n=1 Tax=unclassified Microbacterium TaxID=2609290 RepID=UPI00214B9572|nr:MULTISPECIES: DUF4245 domain-containing protein [unclassified Microbacterium]MCR2784368.1 DUF4245 domain-containing protein [Microbacterium sp. zg.B96]MDL5350724.1 DUF4245 domain-containing protein [Microbacterium sp. zg-YB36]WIM14814.1 DUF4245 domain-containing protein [Microbacterium sp. zg-B96]